MEETRRQHQTGSIPSVWNIRKAASVVWESNFIWEAHRHLYLLIWWSGEL